MAKKLDGADYRLRAEHPRRGGPLGNITTKAGKVIATQPQRNLAKCSQEHLRSMIANGYVELIEKKEK